MPRRTVRKKRVADINRRVLLREVTV